MGVLDIDEINDAKQNFTAAIFARVSWNDPREVHQESSTIQKPLNEVWHPRIAFLNRQANTRPLGQTVDIQSDGTVIQRIQFWGDFSQPMNLRDFPFDTQTFDINVVLVGTKEDHKHFKLVTDPEIKSFVVDDYSAADWTLLGYEAGEKIHSLPTGEDVPAFCLSFTAKRRATHYAIKVIMPLILIILVSWIVFWLDPSQGATQLGLALTSFLTVIAYHAALAAQLPELSYVSRLDRFIFCGTLMVFIALIEVVTTTNMSLAGHLEGARRLDRICRFVFPGLLGLACLYAFVF